MYESQKLKKNNFLSSEERVVFFSTTVFIAGILAPLKMMSQTPVESRPGLKRGSVNNPTIHLKSLFALPVTENCMTPLTMFTVRDRSGRKRGIIHKRKTIRRNLILQSLSFRYDFS